MRSGRFGRNVAAACAIALLPLCAADDFIRADDAARIKRTGDWEWTSHRYAANGALVTTEDGASLEFTVRGQTVLWLDTLTPPNNFGPPELGRIEVFVDGVQTQSVRPRLEDREVRLALASTGEHRVRLVHRAEPDGAGCRVVGIRAVDEPSGDVAWTLSGERNQALLDVRAIVHRGGRIAREALVRNWLTGQCRLVGLPAGDGYTLELRASGWNTARTAEFAIHSGGETALAPVYLRREWDVPTDSFVFPRLGHPVVRTAGGEFRMRVQANRAEIRRVRIVRQQGPATISRFCAFTEDKAARFYYYREGVATMPAETPPGIYDLEVTVEDDGATSVMPSRRCVVVVGAYARDPVFMGFGHLDTWGQYRRSTWRDWPPSRTSSDPTWCSTPTTRTRPTWRARSADSRCRSL